MHDEHATEMLAPPIAQLINSSPLENGSCLVIVALMAVLEASMSRLSSVYSYRDTSHMKLEV